MEPGNPLRTARGPAARGVQTFFLLAAGLLAGSRAWSGETVGTITIHSLRGSDSSVSSGTGYSGHAWIHYAPANGPAFTVATWGTGTAPKAGVNFNRELNLQSSSHRSAQITQAGEKAFRAFIESQSSRGVDAHHLLDNCAAFAAKAWEAATGERISPGQIPNPTSLANNIDAKNRPAGPTTPPRSVSSGRKGGIESHPVSAALALSAAIGLTRQSKGSLLKLEALLPTSGPPGTRPVVLTPSQTMRVGNAVDARAVDFRVDPDDPRTTVATVLVTKTLGRTYTHDYHVCARFHGYLLGALQRIPVLGPRERLPRADTPWAWYCLVHDDRTRTTEEAFCLCAFVSESRRELLVDSRWIASQYAPYWRGPARHTFDYVLNLQVWSSSGERSHQLLLSTLSKLASAGGAWKLVSPGGQQRLSPAVFVEAARLEDGAVCISAFNCLATPRMALFHGTKRASPSGRDVVFELWRPLQPGRNLLRLPVGRVHNAVVFCQVGGCTDKVYVSLEESREWPARPAARSPKPPPSAPQVGILWPPNAAKVVVQRDLTDMPDDCRLTIDGTVAGWKPGSRIRVDVRTDEWYPQEPAVVRDGTWGARVHLRGTGRHNNHGIRVTLVDDTGVEVARHSLDRIVRVDP